jgi:hypothetical protein
MVSSLRVSFSPAHPLADIFHPPYPPIASQSISRDVPLSQARAFQFSLSLVRGVAEAALYCAHRTSTVLSCAFCEQEGHPAAPSPSSICHCRSLLLIVVASGLLDHFNKGMSVKQGYRLIIVDKAGVLVSEFQLTEMALAQPEAFVAALKQSIDDIEEEEP